MTITRQGWAAEIVLHERVDGFEWYDVRLWFSPERQRDGLGKYVIDGTRCDLASTFKMQIRTNHQRIVTEPGTAQEPDGFMRHVSGLLVPQRVAVDEKLLGEFLTLAGKPLGGYTPFMFPTYAGVDEPLSGMWQHERYSLDLLDLADANIERYIAVAKREAWEGDKRGTTLNLQVSSSFDDAYEAVSDGGVLNTPTTLRFGSGSVPRHNGMRFVGVSGMSGVTVDSAVLTFRPFASDSGDFIGDWFADDREAPTEFITTTSNISNRTRTTATQEGDGSDFGNWTNNSPVTFTGDATGIKGILQELADSYDPSEIVLMHIYASGDGERMLDSYNGSSADAPKLDITFTAGGGPTGNPHYYWQMMQRRRSYRRGPVIRRGAESDQRCTPRHRGSWAQDRCGARVPVGSR